MAFEFDAATARPDGEFDPSTATPVKPAGAIRKLADAGLAFGQGAATGTKAAMDALGAGRDNKVSVALGGASRKLGALMSDDAQAEIANRQKLVKAAEESGSVVDEIGATLGGIAEAPVRSIAQGAGSIVPTAVAAWASKGKSLLPMLGIGAAQGAGAVKGTIYDQVQERQIEAGMTPDQAHQAASRAQEYGGENAANIAAGAGLGVVAGLTGAEGAILGTGQKVARGAIRRIGRAVAEEAVTEGVQGGQERYAGNVAEGREGFDTPAFQGVAGQAVGEGVIGGLVGGGVSALAGGPNEVQNPPPIQPSQVGVFPNEAPGVSPVPASGGFDPSTAVPDAPAKPTKSQAMGIDPNAGPISAAAAIAVDGGAAEVVQRQQEELAAAEAAKKPGAKGAVKKPAETSQTGSHPAEQPPLISGALAVEAQQTQPQTLPTAGIPPGIEPQGRSEESARTGRQSQASPIVAPAVDAGNTPPVPVSQPQESSLEKAAQAQQSPPQRQAPDRTEPDAGAAGDGAGPADQPAAGGATVQTAAAGQPTDALSDAGGQETRQIQAVDPETGEITFAEPAAPGEPAAPAAVPATAEGQQQPAGALTVPQKLNVTFGGKTYPVESIEDAQRKWIKFQETADGGEQAGVSQIGNGVRITDQDGKFVARISFNGRVWDSEDDGAKVIAEAPSPKIVDGAAHAAATSPKNDLPEPTDAQKKAGNYKVGRVNVGGMDVSIENPAGSTRRGKDKAGNAWENTLIHHYGYIKGTVGNDKDHVDAFIKPETPTDYAGQVFVIDQIHPDTGKFDEHKVMIGFDNGLQARQAYQANYAKGWKGFKSMTAMPMDEFKKWVYDGPKNKMLSPDPSEPGQQDELDAEMRSYEDRAAGKWFGSKEKAAQKLADLGLTDTHEVVRDGLRFELRKKAPAAGGIQSAMAARGWGAEDSGEGNTFWTKRAGKERYTAILTPATGSKPASMEITVLVDAVDTQIASFQITTAESAAQKADAAIAADAPASKAPQAKKPATPQVPPPLPPAAYTGKGPTVIVNKLGADGLTDAERAAGKKPYTDAPAKERWESFEIVDSMRPGKKLVREPNANGGFQNLAEFTPGKGSIQFFFDSPSTRTPIEKAINAWSDRQKPEIVVDKAEIRPYRKPDGSIGYEAVPIVEAKAKPVASANTIFTEDAAAAARARLKAKLGRLSSGIDPETMLDGITLAGYHIEKGARTFAAYAKAMLDDLGDGVKPYLKSWYMGVKYDPRAGAFEGMDGAAYVENFKEEKLGQDVPVGDWWYAIDNKTRSNVLGKLGIGNQSPDTAWGQLRRENQPKIEAYYAGLDTVAIEEAAEKADTAPNGAPDDSGTQGQGGKTLEDVPTDEVGGIDAGRPGRPGTDQRSPAGGSADSADDAGRGETGRSGGSSSPGTDLPATGDGRPGRGRGAGGGRSGGRVSAKRGASDVGLPAGSDGTGSEERVAPAAVPAANFEIDADLQLGSGGEAVKYRDNLAAIRTLKQIESEHRRATAAEKRVLARYVGWGGLPNAFRNPVTGAFKEEWKSRIEELESLMTPKELKAARASTPNAHYTSQTVVDFMWRAAQRIGFGGGLVLESSVGSGNFIGLMPKDLRSGTRVTGVELDSITARIAGALYPRSTIIESGFDKLPVPENVFDMAIGNPPFGSISLRFQYNPKINGKSIHNQFFLASLDAVKPEGIQVMVVSRFLMDAKTTESRETLAFKAELLGAIRLPGSAFKGNAGTSVVTDILFLRKRSIADEGRLRAASMQRGAKVPPGESYKDREARREEQRYFEDQMAWTKTGEVKDPLGGDPMTVSQYYVDNPHMIAGVMDRSGSQQHDNDLDVKLPAAQLPDKLDELMRFLPTVQSVTPDAATQKRTDEMHEALGESLKIMASGREVGSIYYDEAGDLVEIIERIAENGRSVVTKMRITAQSPWSAQLAQNMEGKWFKEVVKLNDKGEKVKIGRRNVMVREVFKDESEIPPMLRLGEKRLAQLKGLIGIRELYVQQINLETNAAQPVVMEANRAKLRAAYEAFVAEHGYLNDPNNATIISEMPDEGLILSLELKYRAAVTPAKSKRTGMAVAPARAEPNAILTRAVSIPPDRRDAAASASDAVAIVLGETGRISAPRVAELRGITEDEAVAELTSGENPLAYLDPETNELTEKNQYLSGNVRSKLEAAKDAGLPVNIKALEAIQPEPWGSDKVTARLGATWIPPEIYSEFVTHLLGTDGRVTFSRETNVFDVRGDTDTTNATSKWGTGRVPAPDLLRMILNSQRVAVYDTTRESRTLNETETQSANDKKAELVEEFDGWIFKDADRRQMLTKRFNDLYNTRVNRQYDGSHMTFPGKVPDDIIKFRRNQINAVWRGIVDRFTMYDHAVGAGKTFTGIARAIERRRMGLSRKPMIVVPNHLVAEWGTQAYRLYPGAKILAAGVKDLDPKNRRRLFAKIAAGDWDVVIVPHSSFKFIGIAPETEERFLDDELRVAQKALEEAEAEMEPGERFKPLSVKAAEALIKKLETRMDLVRGKMGKDSLLTFEQLGVDDLTVDESHEFKNLTYTSRLTDVRGLGPATGSQKAFDLYTKMRILHENGGSGLFMSGTPISNSAVEMYTIMRYLAPEILREHGLEHFDAYRAQFVDATEKMEPTEAGNSLKIVNRLGRSWSNMRALMDGYYSVADVVTNEDIQAWYAEDNPGKEFPLPKVKGGKRRVVKVEPTPTQQAQLDAVVAGYNSLPNMQDVMERNKERLRLMTRARKVSLHAKVLDPRAEDEPGSKLHAAVDEAMRIYKKWSADSGTQLFFLDRSVPKSKGDNKVIKEYDDLRAKLAQAQADGDEEGQRKAIDALEKYDSDEIAELRAAQDGGWNAYQHMADMLVARGVPKDEIAFIQNYTSDAEKKALFEAVNEGSIRFLFGSSQRMGAGMNVQERLVALHHIDVGWKPSDIEQREGRIIRQGNALWEKYGPSFEVEIMAYVTARSIDAKMWDLNSTKLRMVNGIRYYDGEFEMDFEDDDAIDMAEIAAIASGDPLMLERIKLNTIIEDLFRKRRAYNRRRESAEDSLRSAERDIERIPGEIALAKSLVQPATEVIARAKEDQAGRSVVVNDERYSDLLIARAALQAIISSQKNGDSKAPFTVEIDGTEYKSEDKAEDALAEKLGDVVPFFGEVDGKHVIRRTAVGRKMREMIGDTFVEMPNWQPVGTVYGLPLSMRADTRFGNYVYARVDLKHADGVEPITTSAEITPDKHKRGTPVPVNTVYLRNAVERLGDTLQRLTTPDFSYNERRLKEAREGIPGFKEALTEKFKHSDELDKAISKLDEVEKELAARTGSTGAPQQAANQSMPTPAIDEYRRLEVGSRHRGQMGFNGPDTAFARSPYYSALTREVGKIGAKSQPALGWAMNINGLVKAGKVKQDEVHWTGILDWLRLQEGKVSKEQIAAFLDQNGVRVEETVLSDAPTGNQSDRDTLRALGITIEVNPEDPSMIAFSDDENPGDFMTADELEKEGFPDRVVYAARRIENAGRNRLDNAKYGTSNLVLPGGTNYREVLLTLPAKSTADPARAEYEAWASRNGLQPNATFTEERYKRETGKDAPPPRSMTAMNADAAQNFKSAHWDQPNVLAHIRVNDRTDADGKKVLFVEEIQSDWGQEGKKSGFAGMTPDEIGELDALTKKLFSGGRLDGAEAARRTQLEAKKASPIPTAPFVTKTDAWLSLALKRIVKMAADGGYDRVAFVNGEQSAARYDLSKQIDSIEVVGRTDARTGEKTRSVVIYTMGASGSMTLGIDKGGVVDNVNNASADLIGKPLADVVGKEVAEKLMTMDRGMLSGEGLKIGGEGMKAFYDKIVLNVLKDVLKKLGGGTLETVSITTEMDGVTAVGRSNVRIVRNAGGNFVLLDQDDQRVTMQSFATRADAERARAEAASSKTELNQPGFTLSDAILAKASEDLPQFSRESGSGVDMDDAKAIVAAVREAMPTAPPIHILESVDQAPKELRADIEKAGAENDVDAALHYGEIYIFPGHIDSIERLAFVVAHHEIRHYGLRAMLGPKAGPIFLAIHATNPKIRELAAEQVEKGYAQSRVLAVEEALADMPVEQLVQLNGFDKIIAALRTWLRSVAANLRRRGFAGLADAVDSKVWTDKDVAALIARAEGVSRGGSARYRTPGTVFADSGKVVPFQAGRTGGDPGGDVERFERLAQQVQDEYVKSDWTFEQYKERVEPIHEKLFEAQRRLRKWQEGRAAESIEEVFPGYTEIPIGTKVMAVHGLKFKEPTRATVVGRRGSRVGNKAWVLPVVDFGDGDGRPILPGDIKAVFDGPKGTSSNTQFARSGGFASAKALADVTNTLREATRPIGTVSWWDKSVGTQYHKSTKDADFKRVFDGYVQQTDDTAHYAIEAERNAPDILRRLESIPDAFRGVLHSGAKHKADLVAVSRALFANIEGEEGIKQVRYDDQSLRQIFNLTPKQIEMYHQARGAVDTSVARLAQTYAAQMGQSNGMDIERVKNMDLDDTIALVKEFIQDSHDEARAAEKMRKEVAVEDEDPAGDETRALEKEYGKGKPKAPTDAMTAQLLARLDAMGEHAKFLQESAYMPALRFGQFAVTVTQDDETLHFEMFETQMAANLAAMKLRRQYPRASVAKSVMNPEQYAMFKGVSPETVELFAKFTGADQNEAFQSYIALAKSARSVKMRELKRKGIAGFSDDATRVLAAFLTSNARQSAINMNIGTITDALASKDLARKGDVQREAQKLHEYMANPIEEARRLRSFMFMHFMGGSIASALVNLTQPVMQTAPYLHQWAGSKTASIMLAAARMAATGKIADQRLRDAAKRAADDGITEPHEIHQLMADASGSSFGGNLRARAAVKLWGSFFSTAEAYNRRITFLAAYQVALQTKQRDPYEFARKAVIETQGLYAKVNRPNWARGAVGATIFTFKQFSIAYLEWFTRLPPKQKVLAMAMLLIAAGADGLPFVEDLQDLIDTVGQSLGYNTNSKKSQRKILAQAFGDDLGEILNTGLLSKSAVDVQGRLGMGNLIPGTELFKPSETDKTRSATEIAGPISGVITAFQKALAKAQRGEIVGMTGAIQEMAPVAVKNLLKGIDMAKTGVYKDTRGYKVADVDVVDSFVKMLGLQPSNIARNTRKFVDEMQDKGMVTMMEAMIADRWAQGIAQKDPDQVAKARQALIAWNENNPGSRIVIKPAQILRRVREMDKTRSERFVKTVPKELRAGVVENLR